MKKIVIIPLFLVCFVSACVSAQDTIHWGSPRYMFNPRIQYTHRPYWFADSVQFWESLVLESIAIHGESGALTDGAGYCMRYCATPKEPVTVYGVAIVMDSMNCDTLDTIRWQGTLCQRVGGMLTIVDTATTTNGIDVNRFCASITGDGVLYEFFRPVYEFYFEQPHVMCDSFYVGFYRPDPLTPNSHFITTVVRPYTEKDSVNRTLCCLDPRVLLPSNCITPSQYAGSIYHVYPILQPCAPPEMRMAGEDIWEKVLVWDGNVQDSFQLSVAEYPQPADSGIIYNINDTTISFVDWPREYMYAARVRVKCTSNEAKCPANDRWSPWSEPVYYYFGLTMPDTTQNTPDDTTTNGLQRVIPGSLEMLLTPNPTTGQVTVTCGMEFRHIEVRNAAGIIVFDEYYSVRNKTTIDFNGLPAGQYVVTVETAVGTASKVLTVAR